jgi:predicted  nucleic acid-binding Zn-ribbon protein
VGLVAAVDGSPIVGLLRDAARLVKTLEAENERLRREVSELTMALQYMEEDWATHSCRLEDFEDCLQQLRDFRSGITDADELLDGTVGRQ